MRLFVTAVMLACASRALAQNQFIDTPARIPTVRNVTVRDETSINRQSMAPGSPLATRGSLKDHDTVAPAPVVTLQGVCAEQPAKGACRTVITRDDLQRFAGPSAANLSDTSRARLAVQFAGTLAYSNLAERQSLDRNPVVAKELDEQIKLLRMRFLAAAFLQNLQQRTSNVTEQEIQRYYDSHSSQYQQVQVIRVAVPVTAPTASGARLDRAAVKAEMEELRTRAVAGGDLAQLQQDAFTHLQIQAPPPPLSSLSLRQSDVQGDETKAFDMKPGEISAVLDLPAAFAILKLESKDSVPISAARPAIEAALRQDRMQAAVHKLARNVSAQFDLPYLGLTSQPDIFAWTAMSPTTSQPNVRRTGKVKSAVGTSRWASR